MKRLNENVEYETKPVVGYANDHKDNTHFAIHKPTNSIVFTWDYNGYEPDELKYAKDDYFWVDVLDVVDGNIDKFRKSDFAIVTKKGLLKKGIDLNNYLIFQGQKYDKNVNEGMKRLRFKTPFTGVENALRLIPESYKVDNKTFQMTDGNEKYEIRWEGNITEGSAIILKASDKVLMNEDMQKMKHLMQYNSKDTLGNLRGKERINENKVFNDVWNKTKSIKESSAFGFGFTGEGNLEDNEEMSGAEVDQLDEEDEKTKVIDINTLTKKQQKAIKDTIAIMKKINKSDDSIDEDSIDGKHGEPAPEIPSDDAEGIEVEFLKWW